MPHTIKNYDNTTVGRYIRAIENPDSIGFDKERRVWYNPQLDPRGGKKFDARNRGMGVDVINNKAATEYTAGDPKRELTEEEERYFRNKHIQESLDALQRQTKKKGIPYPTNAFIEAMAIGAIYRGDADELWNASTPMGKALRGTGDDAEWNFRQALNAYNASKNLPTRVVNSEKFLDSGTMQTQVVPEHTITKPERKKEMGGYLQPKDAWDTLSMVEKAEMMKVAVKNGIYNLKDIRAKYNEFAEGGKKEEEDYYSQMEKVAEENYKDWGYDNPEEALVHALNDNTYNYKAFYREHPWSGANATTHWPDTYKTVYHPTFSNESTYSGQVSQYNPLGLPGGFWTGEYFVPMAWQLNEHEYKKGGGIHIKPSHRGRLTELKARTGKSEAELYNDGNPAHKKMVVFARNARKWKHGYGGNLFEDGGDEEITAFTPIKNPVIPKVKGDQEAVNWIANWYNNRREQLYNNLKDYDSTQVFLYNLKDRLTRNPVGRRVINHDYYNKLNNMAQYKTSTFDDLERDNTASYDQLKGETFGITVPETMKIYYDTELMQDATKLQNRREGYSPLGIRIHERTHSSGETGEDGRFTGYNAQTKALEDIIKLKDGIEYNEYMDAMPEIYGRIMEFRYNHNMNPKKKYSKEEVQKMLDMENKGFKSDLQRYDLDSLTKALNEVAQVNTSEDFDFWKTYFT